MKHVTSKKTVTNAHPSVRNKAQLDAIKKSITVPPENISELIPRALKIEFESCK